MRTGKKYTDGEIAVMRLATKLGMSRKDIASVMRRSELAIYESQKYPKLAYI